MSRQEDVRDLAARLAARLPAIDILVNNAGIAARRCVMSAEGFELTFATNHLGHFLSLTASSTSSQPDRDASST